MELFLFAHQDDEYAVAPFIEKAVRSGNTVRCIYLTNGNGHGCSPQIRDGESRFVLSLLGVPEDAISFLGSRHAIPDGRLAEHIESAFKLALAEVSGRPTVTRIYAPAWEGGHPDHDAVHLIGLALAKALNVENGLWEFSIYNGVGRPWRFFRVMSLVPSSGSLDVTRLSFRNAVRFALLCRHYVSQWRTWAGLFPEAFARYVVSRSLKVRRTSQERTAVRPHVGRLLYEKLFGITYEEFAARTENFRSSIERTLARAEGNRSTTPTPHR